MMAFRKGTCILVLGLSLSLILTGCSQKTAENGAQASPKTTETQSTASTDKTAKTAATFDINTLTDAVLSNNLTQVADMLVSGEVDVNSQDAAGQYPLELTLILDNLEMAQLLLDGGANPEVVLSSGETIKEKVMKDSSKAMKALFKQYPS